MQLCLFTIIAAVAASDPQRPAAIQMDEDGTTLSVSAGDGGRVFIEPVLALSGIDDVAEELRRSTVELESANDRIDQLTTDLGETDESILNVESKNAERDAALLNNLSSLSLNLTNRLDGADAAAAAADAKAVAADAKAAAADAKAVEADAKAVAAKDAIPAARNEKAEWLWDGHAGDYDQSMVAKLGMFHSASSMANVRIVDKATDGGASNYHLLGMTAPDAYIEWTINAVQLSKVALQVTHGNGCDSKDRTSKLTYSTDGGHTYLNLRDDAKNLEIAKGGGHEAAVSFDPSFTGLVTLRSQIVGAACGPYVGWRTTRIAPVATFWSFHTGFNLGRTSIIFDVSDGGIPERLPQAWNTLYNSKNAIMMPKAGTGHQYGLIGANQNHAYIAYKMMITNGWAIGYQFDVCNHADSTQRTHFVDLSYDSGQTWTKLSDGESYGATGNHSHSKSEYLLPRRGDLGFTGTAIIRSYLYNDDGSSQNPTYSGWKNVHLHCQNCDAFTLIPGMFQGVPKAAQGGVCDSIIDGMVNGYKVRGLNC